MTTIDPLSPFPARNSPNFSDEVELSLSQLPTRFEQANTQATEINTAKTNAETAASTATTQAGIATTQAGTATTQAGIATTKAGEALTSANNAATSATNAQNYAAALTATSTTSLTIGTGSKTFTTQASKQFAVGQFIQATDAGNSANYMSGQITSYSGTSLIVNVTTTGGSGTIANWTLVHAGVAGPTGPAFLGGTLTSALNEAHGADIASAGTINLTTATGNLVDVTGTTTITAITLADGAERTVRFTGALTLTHGASLVLPGGANITTAAGDFAVFRGYAAGVVRCVSYQRYIAAPFAGSSTTLGSVTTNTTLTSSSGRYQTMNATTDGQSFTLPAATTLSVGYEFVLRNTGTKIIGIRDGAGTLLRTIQPSGVARVGCANTGSTAGDWLIDGTNLGNALTLIERQQVSAAANVCAASQYGDSLVALSSTLVVYASINGTTLYLTAHDLASNTFGTTVTVASATVNGSKYTCYGITATNGCVVFYDTTTAKVVAFTVSGTTVTASAVTTITKATTGFSPAYLCDGAGVDEITPGTYLLAGGYSGAGPYQPQAIAFTVFGTTITPGTLTSIGATSASQPQFIRAIVRSATQAVLVWQDTTSVVSFRHVTISGTTITFDATATGAVSTTSYGVMSTIINMATDEWWGVYGSTGGTTVKALRLTLSGVTPTVTATNVTAISTGFAGPASNAQKTPNLFKLTATTALHIYGDADTANVRAAVITWGGASFTSATYPQLDGVQNSIVGFNDHIVLGTPTTGIFRFTATTSYSASSVDSVGLLAFEITNPPSVFCMHRGNAGDNSWHIIFANGKIYVYGQSSSRYSATLTCYDSATYAKLSENRVRWANVDNSVTRAVLNGNKLIRVGATGGNSNGYTGIYTTVVELC